jgi:hypothetical protein
VWNNGEWTNKETEDIDRNGKMNEGAIILETSKKK